MEWQIGLVVIIGGILLLFFTGMQIFQAFLIAVIPLAMIYWGGVSGLLQLAQSFYSSIAQWTLLPVPFFILMGSVMLETGMAWRMFSALDVWIGKLPGRLGLLCVAGGTLLGAMCGSSIAAVAMMGSAIAPSMREKGYKEDMVIGPIIGAGGLSMIIPPSLMAVLVAAIAGFSVGKMLIGIIGAGLTYAALMFAYIYVRCKIQPQLAPIDNPPVMPTKQKLKLLLVYVAPLALIIFAATGVIFLGIATPTEASATGALSCFILAACYKKLNWTTFKAIMISSMKGTILIFMILLSAKVFTSVLAFSGITRGVSIYVSELAIPAWGVLTVMLIALGILGCFIEIASLLFLTIPIFYPIAMILGFDPVWFGVLYLLACQLGLLSPPFGMSLFVIKGVSPPEVSMGRIYKASIPFTIITLIEIVIVAAFPQIVLWLPGIMFK